MSEAVKVDAAADAVANAEDPVDPKAERLQALKEIQDTGLAKLSDIASKFQAAVAAATADDSLPLPDPKDYISPKAAIATLRRLLYEESGRQGELHAARNAKIDAIELNALDCPADLAGLDKMEIA